MVESEARIASRLKLKGMNFDMAESLINGARSTPELGDLLLERIIEESELLDIHFLRRGARLSQSVIRVVIKSPSGRVLGHGTGFMVSPNLMMTNNHVLPDRERASASIAQFDFVSSNDGLEVEPVEFEFDTQKFFKTNKTLDFTVVALSEIGLKGNELSRRPWNRLIRESGKALVGEPVNIIQHPRGQTMKVALRRNRIVDRLDNFLHYETDTQRGSSGSKVCNDRWEIAALHHSGVPEVDGSGAILLEDGTRWNGSKSTVGNIHWIANEGIRISRIINHLDSQKMSDDESALYKQCFVAMPLESQEFDNKVSKDINSSENDDFIKRLEPDGSVSWYFRVNFGPRKKPSSSATASTVKTIRNRSKAKTSSKTKMQSVDLAYKKAEELLERYRPDLPYYDLKQDKIDRKNYYSNIDSSDSPARLFDSLSKLTKSKHEKHLSYKSARLKYLYPWVDMRENGELRNIYSGNTLQAAELIAQELERYEVARPGFLSEFSANSFDEVASDDLEVMLESSMPFNCEHVVPQSWFGKRQPMKADLHHLFTCEPSCNSFRSNIPYFDFEPILEDDPDLDLEIIRQECGQRVDDKFEPELNHGAVARATLYFLLRYPRQIGDEARELQKDRLDTLISWHEIQKPSRFEKHRNQAIFQIQGNRNPLIDFPKIAKKIRFEKGFG